MQNSYIRHIFAVACATMCLAVSGCGTGKQTADKSPCDKEVTISLGESLNPDKICHVDTGSTVAYASSVDTSKTGEGTATVTVTRADGSIEAYSVLVNVESDDAPVAKADTEKRPEINANMPAKASASPSATPTATPTPAQDAAQPDTQQTDTSNETPVQPHADTGTQSSQASQPQVQQRQTQTVTQPAQTQPQPQQTETQASGYDTYSPNGVESESSSSGGSSGGSIFYSSTYGGMDGALNACVAQMNSSGGSCLPISGGTGYKLQ